jgi:hypothetical protein
MTVPTTVQKIGKKALEAGLFLPLGVYDRVSDVIADLDTDTLRRLAGECVDRGQDVLAPVEARLRTQTKRIRTNTTQVRETVSTRSSGAARSARNRASSAGQQVTTATPRVASPSSKDLAISRYDSLTVDEVTGRLEGLTNTDLAKIYKYESVHENRSTILAAVDSRMMDLPIATYDALTVAQIKSRLAKMSKADLERIEAYESATKKRKTVAEAVRTHLSG